MTLVASGPQEEDVAWIWNEILDPHLAFWQ